MTKFTYFTAVLAVLPMLAWGAGNRDGSNADTGMDSGMATPAGEYPVTREPVTLSIFTQLPDPRLDGGTMDFSSNDFTIWLEEKTGVSLEIDGVSRENMNERLNVLIAGGDLPDILMAGATTMMSIDEINFYGSSGLFRSFTPYIEEYGSVIQEVFQRKPIIRPMISNADGEIYFLPRVTECYHCFRGPKAWYYKPWLDQLGIEVPQTTEEFYAMLKAFRTEDPNGNGKADEIPYTGSNIGWDNSNIIDFIAGSFLYMPEIGDSPGLSVESGRVISPFTRPEYREALRFLNRLYREDLISDLTFTMAAGDYKRTVQGADPHIVGVAQSNYPGVFVDFGPGTLGSEHFYPLSPLEGPAGVRYANLYSPYQGVLPSSMMSASNPHPDVTFRFLETFMLPEASMRGHIGLERINWWPAPEGIITALGNPAEWVIYNPKNPYRTQDEISDEEKERMNNTAWPNRGPTIFLQGDEKFGILGRGGLLPPKDGGRINPERGDILEGSSKYYYDQYSPPVQMILPPITIPEELVDEVDDIGTAITDYISQESVRFIRGEKSVENDWDAYIQRLEGLGLPRFLEIYQERYNDEKDRW